MWIQFEQHSKVYKFDANNFTDLSLALNKKDNVNCYYLDGPTFEYFKSEAFVGSLAAGGSVNCERISFYPHASSTHTECALHVLPVSFDMRSIQIPVLQMCKIFSVQPSRIGVDSCIDMKAIEALNNHENFEAIVLRTLPNEEDKCHENYSGNNPVYFEPEVLSYLQALGFKHILTDLPSIDKESDEGRLAAHKNWFLVNGNAPADRTITELIYVPNSIADGNYVINIQVPKIETDAVPSRILVYPCV
jgi:arylformamidase